MCYFNRIFSFIETRRQPTHLSSHTHTRSCIPKFTCPCQYTTGVRRCTRAHTISKRSRARAHESMCASVCACVIFYSLPLFFSLRTNARSDRLNFNSIQFLSAVASQHSCAARLAFARVCVHIPTRSSCVCAFFLLVLLSVCVLALSLSSRARRA